MKTMNPRKIMFTLSTLVILSIFAVSCKKDIRGCMDPTADNHNHIANVDDGSCSYHGYFTPWYNDITRDSLLANNVDSVKVYIENRTFAKYAISSTLWSAEPECATALGNWITMQGTESKSISLIVRALDDTNTLIREWQETIEIHKDSCELYEIIW